jgi:ABC-type antimicrobial peptide transport system permease subunit
MKIPFRYVLRSLGRRKVRTFLTAFGIAFVIVVTVLMSALVQSMWSGIRNNGSPDNIVLVSRKAQNAIFSSIKEEEVGRLVDLQGVKVNDEGLIYISPEIVTGVALGVEGYSLQKGAVLRGVDPDADLAFAVNDQVRLIHYEGALGDDRVSLATAPDGSATVRVSGPDGETDYTAPDWAAFRRQHEDVYLSYLGGAVPELGGGVIVGRLAAIKMKVTPESLAVGKTLRFGQTELRVVGVFEAPGTSFESEIWAHAEDLKVWLNRRTHSQITIKAKGPGNVEALLAELRSREDVKLNAQPEQEFYAAYTENFLVFRSMILFIGLILAFGGIFAGMNTMYAAVMGRIREIGTLKVLGFPRSSILFAVVAESLLIALGGGVLGAAVAWGLSSVLSHGGGLGIPIKISMNAFLIRVSPLDAAVGLGAAFLIGLVGALPPAVRGIRMKMIDALRWA